MKLSYVVANPTGNITILVLSAVPAAARPGVTRALLAAEPEAEQLGYLELECPGGTAVLQMAGGEFCGNASLSAAAQYLRMHGLAQGRVALSVSGTETTVSLVQNPDGSFTGTVAMPAAVRVSLRDGAPAELVFPGIRHYVTEEALSRETAETVVKELATETRAAAVGLMQLNRENGSLTPLVYVPGADTLFWESSCASGTAAAGVYLARKNGGTVSLALRQPAGVLEVRAEPEGRVEIRGSVSLGPAKSLEMTI